MLITETDLSGKIKYVNTQYCLICGYKKHELVGKDFSILRNHSIPPKMYENLWNRITDNRVWNGTISNKNKNGAYYWLNSTIYKKDENTYISIASVANRKDIELAKKQLEKLK
jgi:PAS domain S-box-containing protein